MFIACEGGPLVRVIALVEAELVPDAPVNRFVTTFVPARVLLLAVTAVTEFVAEARSPFSDAEFVTVAAVT